MRTKNAMKNMVMSIISQIVIILLGFVSRKVFIDSLGTEYLGINGVLTNVITAMILIESGLGISIVYNLYKPLAEKNQKKIVALVQLYKKVYRILTLILLVISIAIYPFMKYLLNTDTEIVGLPIVYALFVGRCMIGYLNGYKSALISADQKAYYLTLSNLVFQVLITVGKIIVLSLTQNYILYLIIDIILYFIQNVVNTKIVFKRYPYINTKIKHKIDDNTTANIKQNVKAMFFHNIGGYIVSSTDNLLMAAFVSVTSVGLYSNYTMILTQLNSLLNSIVTGITGSVGNLIATEGDEKIYDIYKITYFIAFWTSSFTVIFSFNVLEPFITWWLGEGLLLEKKVFIIVLFNLYFQILYGVANNFKIKSGHFIQDKYASLVEGALNLIFSLVLIHYTGLLGVFLGTTLSSIAIPFWMKAKIAYKYVFKKSLIIYFKTFFMYTLIMIATCAVTSVITITLVAGNGFISICIRGIICVVIPNLIYVGIFYKTDEFKYLKLIAAGQMSSIIKKISKNKQN